MHYQYRFMQLNFLNIYLLNETLFHSAPEVTWFQFDLAGNGAGHAEGRYLQI